MDLTTFGRPSNARIIRHWRNQDFLTLEIDDMADESVVMLPEPAKRWLERRLRNDEVDSFTFLEGCDQVKDIPQFFTDDLDSAYREGFEEGFDYCVAQFEEMYRKRGFVRVREICNMLWFWSEKVLRPWRYQGKGKFRDDTMHHPLHIHQETWTKIRERILRRDQKCVRCGDVVKLEVDHIVDVQNGGRPTDENLRTLCKVCHKGKNIWST